MIYCVLLVDAVSSVAVLSLAFCRILADKSCRSNVVRFFICCVTPNFDV